MLRLHVLASGSKGNAAIVQDARTGAGILIDCGICKRDLLGRANEIGFAMGDLAAVLVTHEHTDHTKGIGVVARGLAKLGIVPRVYALDCVRGASKELRDAEPSCEMRSFRVGDALSFGDITVHPFPTSHDAAGSCGFRVESSDGDALGFLTDSGVVLPEAHEALRDVRILALESNHDPRMLEAGPYPWSVKRRIASDRGHLSNDQAALALESLLCARTEQIVAMHVSQNNNTYRAAADGLASAVARMGHPAQVHCAFQDRVTSVG